MARTSEAPKICTIEWVGDTDGYVRLIDQTRLPAETCYLECRDAESIWQAIKRLSIRGAPAIGIAGAMGLVLGVRGAAARGRAALDESLDQVASYLSSSRPTAVNLSWALQRMLRVAQNHSELPAHELVKRLLREARSIQEEDSQMCRAIGRIGSDLIADQTGVLTHCNAGGLATADYGTALAVLFSAHEQGKRVDVFVDETRPLLQGARLTTWELAQRSIPTTLICDSTAAQVMKEGRIQLVLTGADRIARNGDAANKIGTYALALLARAHRIPFYIAAPSSTFDLQIASGADIPIEQRDTHEVTHGFGRQTAPDNIAVYNPAFDVTPAQLIQAIITERGLIDPVTEPNILRILGGAS